MLLKCGFQNFTLENRYPEVKFDLTRSPDIIYLSSEIVQEHLQSF